MLVIKDLKKTYSGGVQALKGVSLELSSGVFGLLGPNGSGKTTLMKIVATLLEPDTGTIEMNGVDLITRKDHTRRMLGYLALALVVVGSLTTIVTQILRGHTPVDISAYLAINGIVVVPSLVFMTSVVLALNVLLRNKYLAYVVAVGTSAGLFYLYTIGYNHWLYNPLLYQLWHYADLTWAGNNQSPILVHRIYTLTTAALALAVAHLFFQRNAAKKILIDGSLSGAGWSILFALISLGITIVTGWNIVSSVH